LSSSDWSTFNAKQPALNGTGFVKISGTTISYDNSTYYLASNPSAYIALTALSASAPLSYNNTTGSFTISQSSGSADGYLSSTDWNTFNNKQSTITLTTSGSSGASTFISNTLNIPTYTLSGLGGVPSTRQLTINGTAYDLSADRSWSVGTVTSVDLSVPTGFTIANNPITTSGTLAIAFASGYSLPTTSSQTNWDAAYNDKINSASVTGTTTKTLTLTQQDGGTITASWTDINTDAVTSVFGRTGAVVATSGDYTTTLVTEGTNLYYTEGRVSANTDVAANTAARHNAVTLGTANGLSLSTQQLSLGLSSSSTNGALSSTDWSTFNAKQNAITLTTTGSSGSATLVGATLNIPSYSVAGLGAVPDSRTITINGVVYDLSANRTFEVGDYGTF
jgi:predicted heme/steroid binding protein